MSDVIAAAEERTDWKHLRKELARRTREPAGDVPFILYFALATVIFGGLGIWAELVKVLLAEKPVGLGGLTTAMITFYPALAGSTALQLVLISVGKSDKVLISFALLLLCLFPITAVLLSLVSNSHPVFVLVAGIVLWFGVMWLWWITNCDDVTYKQTAAPDAATGGNPSRPLSGDLTGFSV